MCMPIDPIRQKKSSFLCFDYFFWLNRGPFYKGSALQITRKISLSIYVLCYVMPIRQKMFFSIFDWKIYFFGSIWAPLTKILPCKLQEKPPKSHRVRMTYVQNPEPSRNALPKLVRAPCNWGNRSLGGPDRSSGGRIHERTQEFRTTQSIILPNHCWTPWVLGGRMVLDL
jgi:hypothetical protein